MLTTNRFASRFTCRARSPSLFVVYCSATATRSNTVCLWTLSKNKECNICQQSPADEMQTTTQASMSVNVGIVFTGILKFCRIARHCGPSVSWAKCSLDIMQIANHAAHAHQSECVSPGAAACNYMFRHRPKKHALQYNTCQSSVFLCVRANRFN